MPDPGQVPGQWILILPFHLVTIFCTKSKMKWTFTFVLLPVVLFIHVDEFWCEVFHIGDVCCKGVRLLSNII